MSDEEKKYEEIRKESEEFGANGGFELKIGNDDVFIFVYSYALDVAMGLGCIVGIKRNGEKRKYLTAEEANAVVSYVSENKASIGAWDGDEETWYYVNESGDKVSVSKATMSKVRIMNTKVFENSSEEVKNTIIHKMDMEHLALLYKIENEIHKKRGTENYAGELLSIDRLIFPEPGHFACPKMEINVYCQRVFMDCNQESIPEKVIFPMMSFCSKEGKIFILHGYYDTQSYEDFSRIARKMGIASEKTHEEYGEESRLNMEIRGAKNNREREEEYNIRASERRMIKDSLFFNFERKNLDPEVMAIIEEVIGGIRD